MDYEELKKDDFDAIVTGELTHQAIWLEDTLNDIVAGYFCRSTVIQKDFRRLILYRDGLTAQDKIEIVRGMILLLDIPDDEKSKAKSILRRIEDFKSWRNAMAHGMDVTGDNYEGTIRIEVVNRAGKERIIEITPQSHREKLKEADVLLEDINFVRDDLFQLVKVPNKSVKQTD